MPVVVQDRGYGPDSAARGVPQLQFLDKVVTCPLLRRLVHGGAAGAVPAVVDVPEIMQRRRVSRTVKVPQIQLILPAEDIPVAQQGRVRTVRTLGLLWRVMAGDERFSASLTGFPGTFLLALSSSLLSSGPDARHHGRHEPEGQLRGEILADMVPTFGLQKTVRSCSLSWSTTCPS